MKTSNYKIPQKAKPETQLTPESRTEFPLTHANFKYMAIAGAAIIIGFLLMLGGTSTPDRFEPEIFSTRRIVIGPAIAFLGFVAMGVAIIYRPKDKKADDAKTTEETAE